MVRPIEAHRLGPLTTAAGSLVLSGICVLVVEDDYYLAMEAKAVLEDAGAEVIGPVSNFVQCLKAIADRRLDCAVVDINLGGGPSFEPAKRLQADSIPFLFLTGYSPEAVPAEFQHVPQTQKPVKAEALVQAVRPLCI